MGLLRVSTRLAPWAHIVPRACLNRGRCIEVLRRRPYSETAAIRERDSCAKPEVNAQNNAAPEHKEHHQVSIPKINTKSTQEATKEHASADQSKEANSNVSWNSTKVRRVQAATKERFPVDQSNYIRAGRRRMYHPAYLRDSCTCPQCIDPSSKQKNFQTTDIPLDIKAENVQYDHASEETKITWKNDIPGFLPGHVSVFPSSFFMVQANEFSIAEDRSNTVKNVFWNKPMIAASLEYIEYTDYMTKDEALYQALSLLHSHGLLLLRNVPESETSIENIAHRIGKIRDTFYGHTWDVRSIHEAKNVAYTHQYLGLHMDLLYMANPPGFQFLHCLKNSCKGGNSLFSDSFKAVRDLSAKNFKVLRERDIAYQYHNAGEHYYHRHPVVEVTKYGAGTHVDRIWEQYQHVNYSPPFQAPSVTSGSRDDVRFPELLESLKVFASKVEHKENVFEYRLQEGECVMFNNRRVLHGRRAFEAGNGERWLKGTYVDTDVFMSKLRVLKEQLKGNDRQDDSYQNAPKFAIEREDLSKYSL